MIDKQSHPSIMRMADVGSRRPNRSAISDYNPVVTNYFYMTQIS